MKTMQTNAPNSSLERVSDDEALKMFRAGKAIYVAKNVWKQTVRDVGKTKDATGE